MTPPTGAEAHSAESEFLAGQTRKKWADLVLKIKVSIFSLHNLYQKDLYSAISALILAENCWSLDHTQSKKSYQVRVSWVK